MIDDPAFYATLRANLSDAAQLEVLDAGCGNQFPIRLDRVCQITGIDVSPESMQRSTRLDRYIVGDIQTHHFDQKFDLIVCMNVLEHVPEPIRATRSLVRRLSEMDVAVVFLREFEGRQPVELRKRSRVLHALYALACSIISVASLRSLRPHLSETLLVARLE